MRKKILHSDAAALVILLSWSAFWLWPFILGSRQPVGGDKTAFFYGVMGEYQRFLHNGELPFWSDRWGFGFPMFAESQCGALYPIHLLLFSTLSLFDAFRWNFILHRILCWILAYLSFRGLRLKPFGALLAALVYSSGGFAINHLDHQWAIEGMCWLPPIVWASESWLKSHNRWAFIALPALIATQLSIGHFQIAFMTLVVIAISAVLLWIVDRERRTSIGGWLLAVAMGIGMAAIQLLPTYELQSYLRTVDPALSDPNRLATHYFPPWLAANFLLPAFYFREPLWREVVWTPARTAPEECLAYVGLLPLVLAVLGCWRWRRHEFVWRWGVVLAAAILLAAGPLLPGHRLAIYIPGFGYFRAAARWMLVVNFALALLAGFAADRWRSPLRLRLLVFRIGAVLLVTCGLLAGWWAIWDHAARSNGPPNSIAQWVVNFLTPWNDGRTPAVLQRELSTPRSWDANTIDAWIGLGRPLEPVRLIDQWIGVVKTEVLPTVVVAAVTLVAVAWPSRRKRDWRGRLLLLSLADLAVLSFLFPTRSSPVDQLIPHGSLVKLVSLSQGERFAGVGGNLAMAWGVSSIPAYRTLNLPMPPAVVTALARAEANPRNLDWLRQPPFSLLNLGAIVLQPFVMQRGSQIPTEHDNWFVMVDDQISWWRDGGNRLPKMLRSQGLQVMSALVVCPATVGAVVLPTDTLHADGTGGRAGLYQQDPNITIGTIERRPETRQGTNGWTVRAEGPSLAIFGNCYFPGWTGRLRRLPDGVDREIDVFAVERYWQGIDIPKIGDWAVELRYHPPGFRIGAQISALAAICWLLTFVGVYFVRRSRA